MFYIFDIIVFEKKLNTDLPKHSSVAKLHVLKLAFSLKSIVLIYKIQYSKF